MFDESSELIVTYNEEILYANHVFLKLIHASHLDELIEDPMINYVPSELHKAVKDSIQYTGERTSPKALEYQIITKNGSMIDVHLTGMGVMYKSQPAIQFIVRDITEEKRKEQELEDYKQRYLSLFEFNPDGVYSMDDQGAFIDVNEALADMLGYSRQQLTSMQAQDVLDEAFLEQSIQSFRKSLTGSQESYEGLAVHKSGKRIPVRIINMPIIWNGKVTGAYGVVRDVSKEKDAYRLQEESEGKYRSLFEHTLDAILELDVNGRYINANKKAEEILGYSKTELLEMSYSKVIIEDLEEMKEEFRNIINGDALYLEQKFRTKNGSIRSAEVGAVPIWRNGKVDGVVAILKDITEKKQNQNRIKELAYTDQLTGLPNRHCFYKEITQAMANIEEKQNAAVLAVDFDNFKSINDQYGHHAGDLFLRKVAKQMKGCLRKEDQLARMGGDEFIIILRDVTEDDVSQIAQRLIKEINQPINLLGHKVIVTLSMGISMYKHGASDIDTIIKQADFAMYLAKESGKNNYQFFTESINKKMVEKDRFEKALHSVIEQEELKLYYQPQIDLKTGELVGLEARPKWHAPFGVVSPDEFIPLAEKIGMMGEIGKWTFRTICRHINQWKKLRDTTVKVSLNISARQLREKSFYVWIKKIIEEEQVAPTDFQFQITESMVLDIDESYHILRDLNNMGVTIGIANFGAGYSSLNFIKHEGIHSVKVDRAFIHDILQSERTRSTLDLIASMGERLNIEVVIDGIETQEQKDLLQEFSVAGQGDYIRGPIPSEHVDQLWNQGCKIIETNKPAGT